MPRLQIFRRCAAWVLGAPLLLGCATTTTEELESALEAKYAEPFEVERLYRQGPLGDRSWNFSGKPVRSGELSFNGRYKNGAKASEALLAFDGYEATSVSAELHALLSDACDRVSLARTKERAYVSELPKHLWGQSVVALADVIADRKQSSFSMTLKIASVPADAEDPRLVAVALLVADLTPRLGGAYRLRVHFTPGAADSETGAQHRGARSLDLEIAEPTAASPSARSLFEQLSGPPK